MQEIVCRRYCYNSMVIRYCIVLIYVCVFVCVESFTIKYRKKCKNGTYESQTMSQEFKKWTEAEP